MALIHFYMEAPPDQSFLTTSLHLSLRSGRTEVSFLISSAFVSNFSSKCVLTARRDFPWVNFITRSTDNSKKVTGKFVDKTCIVANDQTST
eukprot:m.155069 g.155069  ORF g.155069 m.155069 type:complete len:91 (+) comp38654_c0_seq1:219-491(+)